MLKMAHDGVFGDITSGHGGYLHDLRALLFNDGYYTDDWRRIWHTKKRRELLRDARPRPDRGGDGHQPRRPVHDALGDGDGA